MNFPDSKMVERVKKEYPVGCRIVLDHMSDSQASSPGTQGTVKCVDDTGTIFPAFDTGGGLGIVYGEDSCHKIGTEKEALVTLNFYGRHQKEYDARCPRCGGLMPGPVTRHALSRYTDIYVCDGCGTVEALEKAGLIPVKPLMEWTAVTEPQNGKGPWKEIQ